MNDKLKKGVTIGIGIVLAGLVVYGAAEAIAHKTATAVGAGLVFIGYNIKAIKAQFSKLKR